MRNFRISAATYPSVHLPPRAAAIAILALSACSRSSGSAGGAPAETHVRAVTVDAAALPTPLRGPAQVTRDQDLRAPERVMFQSGPHRLAGFVYRPNADGAQPAIVHNHGSEPEPSTEFLGRFARWWQARGFVVFLPFRRGSSGPEASSEGTYWRTIVDAQPEEQRDRATVEQLEAQNDDVLAALAFLRSQAYVDRRFVSVSGCSFGGIEALLTAERSPDVFAALDFAGASFTWARSAPMRERMITAARGARAPVMLLQAENDFDTTPSKELAATMKAAGKEHLLKIYPPFGKTTQEGHAGFCNRAMAYWSDDVLAFLGDAALRTLAR